MSRINPVKPIKIKPVQQRVMRYQVNDNSGGSVTRGDLLNWVVQVTNASTTAVPLCESVKLNRIKVVTFADGGSDSFDVCLEWNGDRSPSTCTSVIGANALPSVINQVPPGDSLARYWSIRGIDESEVLFTLIPPMASVANTYVDLHIEYVIADGAVTTETLSSAASLTGIAYLPLPNSVSTDMMQPVGLTTVFL